MFTGCTPGHLKVDGYGTLRLRLSPHRLPKRRLAGDAYKSPPSAPSVLVSETEAMVRRRLQEFGGEAVADVQVTWSPRTGMWFVEVEPRAASAAPISIGIGGGEYYVALPNSHWEIWRSKRGADPLAVLDDQLEAVMAGRVEDVGWGNDRPVHLTLSDGTSYRLGSIGFPIPWRWCRRSPYAPYGRSR